MEIRLEETCGACPEQYDAFDEDNNYVGYLRLRHGYFGVWDASQTVLLYSAHPKGDGVFEWDERADYLEDAKNAIVAYLKDTKDA